jgi:hypothetical protein
MKLTITGTRIPKGGRYPQRNTHTRHTINKNRRYVKPRGWRPWRSVIRESHKELLQAPPWEKLKAPPKLNVMLSEGVNRLKQTT